MNSWIVALLRCKVPGHANRSHSMAILVPADLLLLIFKASPRPMNGHSRMLPPSPFSIKHISSIPFFFYLYPNPALLRLSCTDTAFGYPYGPKISACLLPPLPLAACESPTSLLSITRAAIALLFGGFVTPSDILAICGGGPTSMGARVISGYRSWRVLSAVSRNAWYVHPRLIFTLTILI